MPLPAAVVRLSPEDARALETYRGQAGSKPGRIVQRWLQWGGRNGDAALGRYVRHLLDSGLGAGTVDLHVRTIRAFYRSLGQPAPTARGFRYDPRDAHRPALARDAIRAAVEAARAGDLTARQASLLCLSSTYGMRASELAAVETADLDWAGERIYIRATHGSPPRWMWLPTALRPWLPETWGPCGEDAVWPIFAAIWDTIGLAERARRTSWHAIRRALARDMREDGIPVEAIGRFFRWADGGMRGPGRMVEHYSHPTHEVGLAGERPARLEDQARREFDRDCWDRHPYLAWWL